MEYARILVNLLLPIGDTLFATPVVRALRQRYPKAYIAVLVYPANQGILEGNPNIDEIFVHPTLGQFGHWRDSFRWVRRLDGLYPLFSLFGELRRRRFELAVDLATFSQFLTRVVCRIPHRIKLRLPFLWWLMSRRNRSWGKTHATDHYLGVVESLGLEAMDRRPLIYLSGDERAFARRYLKEQRVGEEHILVALHPGGDGWYGLKQWAPENFARLGDALVRRHKAKVIILGGPGERELAHRVASLMEEEPINGAGETTLKQTAALLERCQVFVGNDSGPMHVAAAVNTPVVGIYGPSNPVNFGPHGERHRIVRTALPCSPCFYFIGGTPLWMRPLCSTCKCLKLTTMDQVLGAVESLLTTAPREAARVQAVGDLR